MIDRLFFSEIEPVRPARETIPARVFAGTPHCLATRGGWAAIAICPLPGNVPALPRATRVAAEHPLIRGGTEAVVYHGRRPENSFSNDFLSAADSCTGNKRGVAPGAVLEGRVVTVTLVEHSPRKSQRNRGKNRWLRKSAFAVSHQTVFQPRIRGDSLAE